MSLVGEAQGNAFTVVALGQEAPGGISPQVEEQLLSISPRQIDRRLANKKKKLRRRLYGRCKPGTLLKHLVPVRAGAAETSRPGYGEMDLVTSSGPAARGEFAYTLNLTDLASGWCESGAFLGRSEAAVVETLDRLKDRLPFTLLAVNSDNGSEFLNYHLVRYCRRQGIEFTRSRPYKKDDNAHIEQKNWTCVRKLIGWDRYDTPQAVAVMNDLYASFRLMVNLYQPSVRLHQRVRVGSRLRRYYENPKTPLDRLVELAGKDLPENVRHLLRLRDELDPFQLAKEIEAKQQTLFRLAVGRRLYRFERRPAPLGGAGPHRRCLSMFGKRSNVSIKHRSVRSTNGLTR